MSTSSTGRGTPEDQTELSADMCPSPSRLEEETPEIQMALPLKTRLSLSGVEEETPENHTCPSPSRVEQETRPEKCLSPSPVDEETCNNQNVLSLDRFLSPRNEEKETPGDHILLTLETCLSLLPVEDETPEVQTVLTPESCLFLSHVEEETLQDQIILSICPEGTHVAQTLMTDETRLSSAHVEEGLPEDKTVLTLNTCPSPSPETEETPNNQTVQTPETWLSLAHVQAKAAEYRTVHRVETETLVAATVETDLSQSALIQMSELELNQLLHEQQMRLSDEEQKYNNLTNELESLRSHFTTVNQEKFSLFNELSAMMKLEQDVDLKTKQLEKALQDVTKKHMVEDRLTTQIKLKSNLTATLAKAQNSLEDFTCQWELDKSHLQEEHAKETKELRAAFLQIKEEGRKERLEWQSEMSTLLDSLNTNNKALRDTEEKAERFTEKMIERIAGLENTIQKVQSKREKKK